MVVQLLMCVNLGLLNGCITDIDGKSNGFSSGFNYQGQMRTNTVVAAGNDKT